jgi:hypothetical protein
VFHVLPFTNQDVIRRRDTQLTDLTAATFWCFDYYLIYKRGTMCLSEHGGASQHIHKEVTKFLTSKNETCLFYTITDLYSAVNTLNLGYTFLKIC